MSRTYLPSVVAGAPGPASTSYIEHLLVHLLLMAPGDSSRDHCSLFFIRTLINLVFRYSTPHSPFIPYSFPVCIPFSFFVSRVWVCGCVLYCSHPSTL